MFAESNAGPLLPRLAGDFYLRIIVGTRVTMIRGFALIERPPGKKGGLTTASLQGRGEGSGVTSRRSAALAGSRSLNSSKLRRIEGNNFLHSWQEAIERTDRTGRRHATHPRVTQSRTKPARRGDTHGIQGVSDRRPTTDDDEEGEEEEEVQLGEFNLTSSNTAEAAPRRF